MTEHIGVGGAWKVKSGDWIGVGGSWKVISQEYIGVGGVWKLMYSALTVDAAPDPTTGSDSGFSASGLVTSDVCTATVTYGSGSYTYLWEHVSTSSGSTPTVNSSTSAAVGWSATVEDGTPSTSIWRVTVTDTAYGISTTDTVTVQLIWTNIS